MRKLVVTLLLAGSALTAQANDPRQITPVTCAAVFDTAAREYTRLGRTQDYQASDYLATAFEQQALQAAGPKGRVGAVQQLRSAQDIVRVTAQMNGGLRWLQPRIGACVGLADQLGI